MRIAGALPAVAGLAWAAALFLLTGGYAIDDAWIHLQFARNIAAGEGFRFLTGHPQVYACTSPAWVLLLAPAYTAGAGGIATARALSCLASGAALAAFASLLRNRGFGGGWIAAGCVLLAMDPMMIRWGSSGMEAAAASLAVILVLRALARRGGGALTGLLCGLAFLLRPELGIAGPLVALAMALEGARRNWGRILAHLACWAAVAAAWEVAALGIFGRLLPGTAAAKASAAGYAGYLPGAISDLAGNLAASGAAMPALITAGAAAWALIRGRRLFPLAGRAAILISAGLFAVLLAGKAPIVSRYLLPATPCLLLAAIETASALRGRAGAWLRGTALTAALASSLVSGIFLVFPHMQRASRNLGRYMEVAGFLRDSLPEGSIIAVQEIGIFGYESGRELLDLGGLLDPSVTAGCPGLDRQALQSIAFLRQRGVTHYLDPHGAVPALEGAEERTGVRFVPLHSWEFAGGTALSSSASYERVLYRLDWL